LPCGARLDRLPVRPAHVQVDGCCLPVIAARARKAIVDGDCKVAAISAASILAKVYRDEEMRRLHALYPEYGLRSTRVTRHSHT
jgi:ribonuclease HII